MSNVAIPPFITMLTGKQMKTVAFLLGMPTTGLKAEISASLSLRLDNPPPQSEFSKILSIDMGIRNLGVCVLQAPHLVQPPRGIPIATSPLTISAWDKVDVLSQLKTKDAINIWDSDSGATERKEIRSLRRRKSKEMIPTDFTPANLAEAAYKLIAKLLVEHQPTVILIERQRFRSSGLPNVQEWTLRVNLLEHMMWACLRTLSAQYPRRNDSVAGNIAEAAGKLQSVREVSPAKVAKFWCGAQKHDLEGNIESDGAEVNHERNGVRKIDKADKIAVAQRWVDEWKAGGNQSDTNIRLEFKGAAADTASAFQSGKRKPRKKKGEDVAESEESIGKLDDLADCLLQGVAWVKWEENRRRLAERVAMG